MTADHLPAWLQPLVEALDDVAPPEWARLAPPDDQGRPSAVLVLLGEEPAHGPDLLLIQRSDGLRTHAGQPAFPGGTVDPDDDGPVATALREAQEETGLDPAGVQVVAQLPPLWLPPSGFVVTPVVGWWREPSPVRVADPAEVATVQRVPVAELADPANRLRVRHPRGYVGPAFRVRGMVVWGFTAMLVDRLLAAAGWELPWDPSRVEDLPVDRVLVAEPGRGESGVDRSPAGGDSTA